MSYTVNPPEPGANHETMLSQAGESVIALGELIGQSGNSFSEECIYGIAHILDRAGRLVRAAGEGSLRRDLAWKAIVERAYEDGFLAGRDSCQRPIHDLANSTDRYGDGDAAALDRSIELLIRLQQNERAQRVGAVIDKARTAESDSPIGDDPDP